MTGQTIMIIRHAEKPETDGGHGVDETGISNKRSLTPRGWQRAGAWVQLFAPALTQGLLPQPAFLFASAPASDSASEEEGASKSLRPLETVTPLAAKLGLRINLDYAKGQESELADALSARAGVMLVCWQHEDIIPILRALRLAPAAIPAKWPKGRFNVLIRLDRNAPAEQWALTQVVPVMLGGDKSTAI